MGSPRGHLNGQSIHTGGARSDHDQKFSHHPNMYSRGKMQGRENKIDLDMRGKNVE